MKEKETEGSWVEEIETYIDRWMDGSMDG